MPVRELKVLLSSIIDIMSSIYTKLKKLDKYWRLSYTITATPSSVLSTYSVTVSSCTIRSEMIDLNLSLSKTSGTVSSGTTIGQKLCTITLTGIQNLIPSGIAPLRTETVSANGPIINFTITNCTRVDDDTITGSVYIGHNVGLAFSSSTEALTVRFFIPVARLLPE